MDGADDGDKTQVGEACDIDPLVDALYMNQVVQSEIEAIETT